MSVVRPVLGCLGCLLVLGTGACGHRDAPSPATARPASAAPSPASVEAITTHDDIVATRKYSGWLLHAVPMPPGARQWRRSPTAHFRHASLGIGPSDPKLSRTTWWTVPLSPTAFAGWLRHHVPHGLSAGSGGGLTTSQGVSEVDYDFRGPSTTTHTEGWVNFAFTPDDGGLAVRVDTFVDARFARTVRVPADTTSVTIRRARRLLDARRAPRATTRTFTDPATVRRVVTLVNALPGVPTVPSVRICPLLLVQQSYRLAFTGPRGSYVARMAGAGCLPEVTLTHDGVTVGPRLDPGQTFTRAVDRVLGS